MLPEKYKANDFEKLLKKLQTKTTRELERGFAVQQTDTLMTVLDVCQRQATTLKEVHDQLLEFFTSLKLVRLDSIRAIIDKGVQEFKVLPKVKLCDCVVFENKCHACSLKGDLMQVIMSRVSEALEKSPMWRHADQDEKSVAEKACERSLVDQIPREILMPALKEDTNIQVKLLATEPLNAKDCGIGPHLIHGFPYVFAQQEFVRLANFRSPHDKMWAIYKIFSAIEGYITCGGIESGADERNPVRIFLMHVAYTVYDIRLLSHIQYILLYGYGMPRADKDVLQNFTDVLTNMVELAANKRHTPSLRPE